MKLLVVFFAFASLAVVSEAVLINGAVYKIRSVFDGGVLSMRDSDIRKIYSELYTGKASQQWQLIGAVFPYVEWELKSIEDETLGLTLDSFTSSIRGTTDGGFGKLWIIEDLSNGKQQIRNSMNSQCLMTRGLNLPVVLSGCDGSPHQQWNFE